ncbi:MAG TPA: DUF5691 domain-containing protein, partial [Roseiflexaceae bacterium]|nr:DUF5691 domain-containing protein [Roseiflexaceae bacterium]
ARGRWLASLNPAWDYASAELKMLRAEHSGTTRSTQHAARSTWETSPRPTRLALLRAVRAADPVAGRELLRSTWASEKADDRAAFLAELRAGLGPGDEPFLEAALDDRSKEVRATAADLLSRLPGSQLSQRMCERLRPLLSWWPGEPAKLLGLRLGRGPRLEAVLPAAYDKGMARDGVEQRPRSTALGERAWWLAQMLAAVPPAEWSAAWHTAPEELVQAALQHELADALLSGWWAATARHPDAAWAEALLIHATRRTLAAIAAGGSTAQALVEQLPPEHFERFALAQLGVPGGLELIAAAQRPWSLTLARAAVAALQAELRKGARSVWRDGYLLQAIGQRAPAALYAEFDRGWPTDAPAWPQWAGYVAQARELLEFRYVMLKEI